MRHKDWLVDFFLIEGFGFKLHERLKRVVDLEQRLAFFGESASVSAISHEQLNA